MCPPPLVIGLSKIIIIVRKRHLTYSVSHSHFIDPEHLLSLEKPSSAAFQGSLDSEARVNSVQHLTI